MDRTNPLVSQIVTFHTEGVLAHFTLSGLVRVREYSRKENVPLEFVLVLDRADELTTRIVKSHPLITGHDQVIEVNFGDPSLSRNCGIKASRAEYIGIMDGDDYCSANWLVAALDMARNSEEPVVIHPELCVSFGASHSVMWVLDMNKDHFTSAACLNLNPWVSVSFGLKDMYAMYPYHYVDLKETGFGYEDWHWNVELLGHNIKHICAPKTVHFYRRAAQSRLVADSTQGAIIRPSVFFDQVEHWGDFNAGAAI